MRSATRKKTGKDKAYLEFIRRLPCVICWGFPDAHTPPGTCQVYWEYERDHGNPSQSSPTEAAHAGPRGLSQKAEDKTAIPLCAEHHREGRRAIHRLGTNFWITHGLDREALIASLQVQYEQERSAAA